MSSHLTINEGVYKVGQRFSFTNISKEIFKSKWAGKSISVNPGESILLSDTTPFPGAGMGHCLAVKLTTELTNLIMMGEVKAEESKMKTPYARSPKGALLGVPEARKPYEDKILKDLGAESDEIKLEYLVTEKINEIKNDGSKKEGVSYQNKVSQKPFAAMDSITKEQMDKGEILN